MQTQRGEPPDLPASCFLTPSVRFPQYISNAIVQPPQTDDSDAAKFTQNLVK